MIDIVGFQVDKEDKWIKKLGFSQFLYYKNLNVTIGGDEETNLKALKNRSMEILMSPETAGGKDNLHYRNSGLNQVLLKLASKNGIAIGFPISSIINEKGDRAKVIGRMMQNVRLCRKYKVKMVLCSFAKNKWELRNSADIASLGRVLGMTPQEAKQALNFKRESRMVRVLSR